MRQRRDYYSNSKDYINRWIFSYADFTTLLLAMFMFLVAMNHFEQNANSLKKQTIASVESKLNKEKQGNIYEKLNESFAKNSQIEITRIENGSIIRIKDKILFDSGSALIKEDSVETLNRIADFQLKIENPVIIEGHTDSMPIKSSLFQSNRELSTARAINIIKFFIQQHKISPKRLSAVGYGEYKPIEDNTTNIGREKNRRVDIIILNNSVHN